MADLGVARFIPGDAPQIVFGLEIFEANVPNERAERFDGVDFVALRADEAQPDIFVGILRETRFAISRIVVARVLECFETRVANGDRAALEWFRFAAKRLRLFVARIASSHAAD